MRRRPPRQSFIGPTGQRPDSSGAAAGQAIGKSFDIQYLERRVLLSAAVADVTPTPSSLPKGVVEIEWQGQTHLAKAGEWILKLDNVTGQSRGQVSKIDRLLNNANIDADVLRHLNADGVVHLTTPRHAQHGALLKSLRKLSGFEYLEPNFVFRIAGAPADPRYGELWSLDNTGQSGGTPDADIDAPEAWDLTTGDPTIGVAVIDTGVDYTHPDLAANVWTNAAEIPNDQIDNDDNGFVDDWRGWDFANDDNDPMDDNGHGTHVAGTVAAVGNNNEGITGVSWNSKILPLKFTDAQGFGEASAAIAAINYTNMMALSGANIRVANNSWGGFEFSRALFDAIAGGLFSDVLYVAAAGNDASDIDARPVYPAAYRIENLITVAATDDEDWLHALSNYGVAGVHVAAPGENILSTLPGGQYGYATGSSYAAPHVAGIAALAWSVSPNSTFTEVREAIEQGGDALLTLEGLVSTGRRVNALGTLMRLPMQVHSVTPGANEIVATRPTEFIVRFTHPVTAGTLQASDLAVNGIAANAVTLDDARTATFRFGVTPVASEGEQSVVMAAGGITRAPDDVPLERHESMFRYDAIPLRVVSSSPQSGGMAHLPFMYLELNFTERVDAGSVGEDDLMLSQGSVTRVEFADENTVRYLLTGVGREALLEFELQAGAVTDVNGGPSDAFAGQVNLDVSDNYPLTLMPILPSAHGVHEARFEGAIVPAGDSDTFTITLPTTPTNPAGRKLSFAIDAAPTLAPRIVVRTSGGAFLASESAVAGGGGGVALQHVASTDGTFVVTVSGDAGSTGTYRLRVVSDSAVEDEDHAGPRNDTTATAQDLDAALRPFGGNVRGAAVAGRVDLPPGTLPTEQEPNNSTGAANSGRANFITRPESRYQLAVKASLASGSDIDHYNIGRLHRGDVLTITVSGAGSSRGTLGDPFVELFSDEVGSPLRVHEDDDGGPHTDSLIYRYRIESDDTYFIRAKAYAADTGTYDLAVYLEDAREAPQTFGATRNESEPNDAFGSATDVSTSWQQVNHVSTTTATIAHPADRDFYAYDFRKGDTLTVRLDAASTLDARLTLSGPSGSAVATDDGTSLGLRSGAGIFSFVAPSAGRYYLEVSARSGSGAYTTNVEVSGLTPPTSPADASDYYALTLAPGELFSVAVSDQEDTHVAVELYGPDGLLIARGTDGGITSDFDQAIAQHRVQEPGRYFVRVIGDRHADYQLLLTRGAAFETGGNNSDTAPLDLGDAHAIVGHSLAPDYYRFDVNAGDTIELRTFTPETAGVNPLDPVLSLFGPSGALVASDANSAADGRNAVLTYRATVAGTYKVLLSSQFGTGPYVLQVGGNVLSGIDGTDGNDTFYVRAGNGDQLQVYRNADPNGAPTFLLSRTGTSRLRINGRGGDDLFIVDFTNGSPIPPGGAAFDGGPGNDRLRLTGTTAAHEVTVGTNQVRVGTSLITYTTMGSVGLDALPGDPVIDLGSLTVNGSGRVALVQGSNKVLKLNALSITEDGVLDLTDNGLVLSGDAGSRSARLTNVHGWIGKSRNAAGGRWTGGGITSSVANDVSGLAAVANDNGSGGALVGNFRGVAVGVNDVIVKYTYNGDSNLDGKIDADDYFRIDSGFLAQRANPKYRDGDFNYDARVNADDYFLIDESFLRQGAVMSAASATAAVSMATSVATAPPVSVTFAAVEEQQRRKPVKRSTASVFSTTSVRQATRRSPRPSR